MPRVPAVRVGEALVPVDKTAKCRACQERILHIRRTDLWLHVTWLKDQRTKADHVARPVTATIKGYKG